jgi:hypothetical protein
MASETRQSIALKPKLDLGGTAGDSSTASENELLAACINARQRLLTALIINDEVALIMTAGEVADALCAAIAKAEGR